MSQNSLIANILLAVLFGNATIALSQTTSTAQIADNTVYSYKIPYEGAWDFTLKNNNQNTITINQITFDANSDAETCWGELWTYGSKLSKQDNLTNQTISYTFTLNKGVTLKTNEEKKLTCQYSNTKGPLPLAMNPTNVSVNGSAINVDDKCIGDTCNNPVNGKWVMGYYTNWDQYARKYNAKDLPVDEINTVNYAFIGYDQNGNVQLLDPNSDAKQLPAINTLRHQYPYLNAAISFGGWTMSTDFPLMTANPTTRAKFVENAVKAMKEVGFNGIDIDWEYPTQADAANFVALVQELRTTLDIEGKKDNKKYYLTIAAPAGIDKINNLSQHQWQQVAQACDYIDIMTYDFHGAWDQGKPTSFMAAMQLDPKRDPYINDPILGKYNIVNTVEAYENNGIPTAKLVLGIPTYGRTMKINGAGNSYGLYQTITGTPEGEFDSTGFFSYKCISNHSLCYNGTSKHLKEITLVNPTNNDYGTYGKTPWGYSNEIFMTYEDNKSTVYKIKWLKEKGMGGTMLWTFADDSKSKEKSITTAIYNGLKDKSTTHFK